MGRALSVELDEASGFRRRSDVSGTLRVERSTRLVAVLALLGAVALPLCAAVTQGVMLRQDEGLVIWKALCVWPIALGLARACATRGLGLLSTGGTWLLAVDDDGIVYRSPDEPGASFAYRLDEISATEWRCPHPGRTGSAHLVRHALVLASGDEVLVPFRGGINPLRAFTALEARGIPTRIVRVDGREARRTG